MGQARIFFVLGFGLFSCDRRRNCKNFVIVKFCDVSGHVGVMSHNRISDGMGDNCCILGMYKDDMDNCHFELFQSASIFVCVKGPVIVFRV